MTLQECYAMMHGNYEDARSRLAMDKLIEKFMLKFLDDTSMDLLNKSVAAGDVQESFRAAHTLKGVAAKLMERVSELTEQLRPCSAPADEALYQKVKESYDLTIHAIEAYKAQI